MEYQLARDGHTFGPYTRPEVEERLANGHILPTDIARTEGMDEWLPIATLFPAAAPTPVPGPGGLPQAFPDAPNLHWIALAVLEVVTVNCFSILWDLYQSLWMKRVNPRSTALWYYLALAAVFALKAPQSYHTMLYNLGLGLPTVEPFGNLLLVLTFVLAVASRLVLRRELLAHYNRAEPIGLSLSWLLTLLFGGIYFQYHLNRLNALKDALRRL